MSTFVCLLCTVGQVGEWHLLGLLFTLVTAEAASASQPPNSLQAVMSATETFEWNVSVILHKKIV